MYGVFLGEAVYNNTAYGERERGKQRERLIDGKTEKNSHAYFCTVHTLHSNNTLHQYINNNK